MHDLEKQLRKLNVDLKRLAKKMGVVDFGKLVGLSKTDVSSWLSGKLKFSYKKTLRIADKAKKILEA